MAKEIEGGKWQAQTPDNKVFNTRAEAEAYEEDVALGRAQPGLAPQQPSMPGGPAAPQAGSQTAAAILAGLEDPKGAKVAQSNATDAYKKALEAGYPDEVAAAVARVAHGLHANLDDTEGGERYQRWLRNDGVSQVAEAVIQKAAMDNERLLREQFRREFDTSVVGALEVQALGAGPTQKAETEALVGVLRKRRPDLEGLFVQYAVQSGWTPANTPSMLAQFLNENARQAFAAAAVAGGAVPATAQSAASFFAALYLPIAQQRVRETALLKDWDRQVGAIRSRMNTAIQDPNLSEEEAFALVDTLGDMDTEGMNAQRQRLVDVTRSGVAVSPILDANTWVSLRLQTALAGQGVTVGADPIQAIADLRRGAKERAGRAQLQREFDVLGGFDLAEAEKLLAQGFTPAQAITRLRTITGREAKVTQEAQVRAQARETFIQGAVNDAAKAGVRPPDRAALEQAFDQAVAANPQGSPAQHAATATESLTAVVAAGGFAPGQSQGAVLAEQERLAQSEFGKRFAELTSDQQRQAQASAQANVQGRAGEATSVGARTKGVPGAAPRADARLILQAAAAGQDFDPAEALNAVLAGQASDVAIVQARQAFQERVSQAEQAALNAPVTFERGQREQFGIQDGTLGKLLGPQAAAVTPLFRPDPLGGSGLAKPVTLQDLQRTLVGVIPGGQEPSKPMAAFSAQELGSMRGEQSRAAAILQSLTQPQGEHGELPPAIDLTNAITDPKALTAALSTVAQQMALSRGLQRAAQGSAATGGPTAGPGRVAASGAVPGGGTGPPPRPPRVPRRRLRV